MIVCRFDDSRLLLVMQTDHSRAAGLLAAHWGNNEFARPQPYASMVLAAQEHDSGWWEWEIKPTLNAQGFPLDYIGSSKHLGRIWLDFYRHGIERVAEVDPYAAYNISMHGEGLLTQGMGLLPYMPDYSGDPDVQEFIRGQKALRARLLEDLRRNDQYRTRASDEHLWTNFKMMEVFDQFAQFLCNRYPFDSKDRKNGPSNTLSNTPVPVELGRSDTTLTVDVQDGSHAIVRPYPFDVDPLVVSFPARLVPDRSYGSQEEFLQHFYRADRMTVTYTLHAR
ncbi:MAG: DUF3891 family protein [Deltaproteobacteria bacterium]|nr:DUF3891 family protein [Deltaproteobacteria bacterium]